MAVKPLEDRVLVKPIENESKTESGLYLPESSKERPVQGTVVAVGPGKKLDSGDRAPMNVKKGDKVLFSKYSGTEITLEGEEHLIIREDDVLGIIE